MLLHVLTSINCTMSLLSALRTNGGNFFVGVSMLIVILTSLDDIRAANLARASRAITVS